MRRPRRGVTLTELLTVVSVITILAAMVTPILVRAQQGALTQRCKGNLGQLYQGIELYANDYVGRPPRCFDVHGTSVDEYSWWYRKLAETIHPQLNPLDIPTSDFRPDRCVLRCPASPDHYDQAHTPSSIIPRVSGDDATAKDRVYDNNYGYNNYGFSYDPGLEVLPNPATLDIHEPGTNPLYHGSGAISGQYIRTADYAYIGAAPLDGIPDMANTILMMDYVKADVAPIGGSSSSYDDRLYGYRFRHGGQTTDVFGERSGRANVLLCNGNVQTLSARAFLNRLGKGQVHWEVLRR
ncbi:MAG: type II secretion system protein [Candidatus Brocadiia bacterium]